MLEAKYFFLGGGGYSFSSFAGWEAVPTKLEVGIFEALVLRCCWLVLIVWLCSFSVKSVATIPRVGQVAFFCFTESELILGLQQLKGREGTINTGQKGIGVFTELGVSPSNGFKLWLACFQGSQFEGPHFLRNTPKGYRFDPSSRHVVRCSTGPRRA